MLLPKKYRIGVIVAFFAIIELLMVIFNLRDTSTGFVRKISLEIVSSLDAVISMPLKGLREPWKRYVFLVGLQEDNKRLQEKNIRLTGELIKYREGYLEAVRLQQIVKLQNSTPYHTIAARVIGRNPSSILKMILIDRGEVDGLCAGLPVVAVAGVVGRVVETSWNVSRVLLIVDENSNIDALVQESRTQGILQGAASAGCNLKYVSKTAEVKAGDIVVSSGLGGVFPKGLPLGVINSASKKEADLFQKVNVAPFVGTEWIEEVLVIMSNTGK